MAIAATPRTAARTTVSGLSTPFPSSSGPNNTHREKRSAPDSYVERRRSQYGVRHHNDGCLTEFFRKSSRGSSRWRVAKGQGGLPFRAETDDGCCFAPFGARS